ncbi:hypothetical protein Q7F20_01205 [Curtobacterium sp. A7_M15]|uniref:hypothetical protein n=1 Tax=Curtobacterium sp. A7_M15 TaxID=3065241 RepID=UPI002737CEDF|nr:hypothetical protein [Curtobacterium sp. A7_M15]MDP4331980.1 hypothetical protein [Curtobacterium sp. A7_M15]
MLAVVTLVALLGSLLAVVSPPAPAQAVATGGPQACLTVLRLTGRRAHEKPQSDIRYIIGSRSKAGLGLEYRIMARVFEVFDRGFHPGIVRVDRRVEPGSDD